MSTQDPEVSKYLRGYIYIIEDLWAISQLNLHNFLLGFQDSSYQQYAPSGRKKFLVMDATDSHIVGGNARFRRRLNTWLSTREYEY